MAFDLFDRASFSEIQAETRGEKFIRSYQGGAVDSVFAHWAHGRRSTMVCMATGTGKTVVFAQVIDRFPRARGRVLVLVNREELVDQAYDEIVSACPGETVEVEHQDRRASRRRNSLARDETGNKQARSRIVVASKDTLWRRVKEFDRDEFGLIVIDECHHWTKSNKSYQVIVDYFFKAVIFGTTATPTRGDGVDLGTVFESVAAVYPIATAVRDGWLVPIVQKYTIIEGYDLSTVRMPRKGADFSKEEIEQIWQAEKPVQSIVYQTLNLANSEGQRRKTVSFMGSVRAAEAATDIANRWHSRDRTGLAACVSDRIDGETRREVIKAFRRGEIRHLYNYGTLIEGFDVSDIGIVVMGRLTRSVSVYEQMLGRGTRPLRTIIHALNHAGSAEERRRLIAQSEKPDVWVLDPVGVSGYHNLGVVDAIDVLGCNLGPCVIEDAKKAAIRGNGTFRTIEELAEAKRRIEEHNARERERRSSFVATVDFHSRDVDPFEEANHRGNGDNYRRDPMFRTDKPSFEQISFLQKLKFRQNEIEKMTASNAQFWIRKAMGRRRRGLCSIPKYRLLKRYGFTEEQLDSMTEAQASEHLDSRHGHGGGFGQ